MTDKWQTRPLVREGAPHGQDSSFQTRRNIWSGLDTKTDRLTDRQLQSDFDLGKALPVTGREGPLGMWDAEAPIFCR
jgi:hypothetical protein